MPFLFDTPFYTSLKALVKMLSSLYINGLNEHPATRFSKVIPFYY